MRCSTRLVQHSLVLMCAWRAAGVESSAGALALARHNAARNGVADRCEWVRGDIADFMRASAPQAWDIVVLDPPKLAPSRKVRPALRARGTPGAAGQL